MFVLPSAINLTFVDRFFNLPFYGRKHFALRLLSHLESNSISIVDFKNMPVCVEFIKIK